MRIDSMMKKVAPAVRSKRGCMLAAVAGAAMMAGLGSSQGATTTYNWSALTGNTTADWAVNTNWAIGSGPGNTAGYPGGDATILDDAANIAVVNGTTGGVITINLNAPLPAATIESLTVNMQSTTSGNTDGFTVNVNSNLTTTGAVNLIGGASSGGKYGRTILNVASGANLTAGGTVTLSGSDGNGSATLNINGDASFGGLTMKNDGDNVFVNAGAGNVSLGNVNIQRSQNSTDPTKPGLHLLGGNITANNFLVGSGNSSGIVQMAAPNLTVTGNFIVGDNGSASTRVTTFAQQSGNVTAANSVLQIGSSTVGTSGSYILSGGVLTVQGIQMTNAGGPAANVANFTMSNGASLNVGAAGIQVGSGTNIKFTSTGGTIAATGSWTSPVNMALTSGTTTFQSADGAANPFDITLSGALSGGGSVVKTGGGNLTLAGNNTYTGGTTVNAGTLFVNNTSGSGTGTGPVVVTAGGLGGSGTVAGDVTINSGAHLAPGNDNVGTLHLGNLTLSSGSILDFDFNTAANSMVNLTGSLTINGGGINLYQEGTTNPFTTNGTYDLFALAGSVPGNFNALQILNGAPGVTYTLGSTAHDITLTITGGTGAIGWAKDANGSWGTASNWNGGIPSGTDAIFPAVLTAPRTVTLDGDRTVTGVSLNSTSGYTLAQGSGGSLILNNGSNTATVQDFAGPQTISAPIVMNSPVEFATTNPTDTLTLSGVLSGSTDVSVAGSGTVVITGSANTISGNVTNNGNLQIGSGAQTGSLGTAAVVNNGILSFNSSATQTVANNIAGTGGVTQNGTGVLVLSGANTYTGTTNINSGIVRYGSTTGLAAGNVNIAAGGKLDLNGLNVSVFDATGAGSIDNMLAGSNATLTFNGANPSFSGTIQNTGGNLSVVSSVSGRLSLSGNNTYSGGTSVTSGTVLVGSNNAFGTGTVTLTSTAGSTLVLASGVVVPNSIVLNDGSIEFANLQTAGTSATFAGPISTVGSTQYRLGNSDATSTLIMTGPSTVGSGITLLTRGTIVFNGNGSLIATGNAVTVGRNSSSSVVNLTATDNAVIRGKGINLGGLNSSSDDGTVNVTLDGNAVMDAGANRFSLNNSAVANSLVLTQQGNSTVSGSSFEMTGSKTGGGSPTATTLWLINSGNIVATANNANFMPASAALTVALAGNVTINDGGFNVTIAQPFVDFGGGGINKTGTGTLALAAANNGYSGQTNVTQGTLFANATGATGSGAVNVSSGATLGGTGSITGAVTVNGHLAPGAGATIGTLTLGGGVTLASGSTLDMNIAVDGSGASLLDISGGSLTNSGAALDLYQAGTTSAFNVNGTYKLVNFDGGFVDPGFSSVANAAAGVNYVFSHDANALYVTVSGGLTAGAWAVDADGAWETAGNWTGGVPNGTGAIASFGSVITAPRTVTNTGTKTVGQIYLNNANAYTLTGGTIVLDNGAGGGAQVTNTLGNHTIASAVTLASNTTVSVANAADSLTLSGAVGGSGALTKSGPGALVVSGQMTSSAPVALAAGSLTFSGSGSTTGLISGAGNLTVSGGTKAAPGLTAAGVQTNALTITGALKLASGSPTSKVNSYSLAGATGAWTANWDLNGNKAVIEDSVTKATTIATLRDQIAFGKANAFGISSTGLASNYGIAVLDNAVLQKTTFGTATVDANSVLVAPEILGDSNADGKVDLTDLSTVLNNFGVTTSEWTSGNFDGAATINLTDLSDVLNNFGVTNPNAALDTVAAVSGGKIAATPEPGTLMALGIGAAALLTKRRRASR
ncbi:MAG: autotransporter-associated beta strand repeat-containing protein [Phycisphaerae bacterium]